MAEIVWKSASPDDLDSIASALLEACKYGRKFAFYGSMGIGKTTFIKAICTALGCTMYTSSPTFSIVNEYQAEGLPVPVYHIDLYRLNDIQEALDAGLEDYLDQDAYCFIEWPQLAEQWLDQSDKETVVVRMDLDEEHNRIIRVSGKCIV